MSNQKTGLLWVHMAVLGFGLSGLFAKLVDQPAIIIAWGRVVVSSITLFLLFQIRRQPIRLREKKEYGQMILAGMLLALHWTAFMQSIQLATVAVGTLTFSTYSLFVTFMEPYLFHEKLKKGNVICAVIMLIGVVFIVPKFELGNAMTQGVIWGMLSSLTYAVLSLMNRKFSVRYPGPLISFYEQGAAAITLLPAFFLLRPTFTGTDIAGLLILGAAFTAGAHSLFIQGLKSVKVQTAGIISSLESVYGILGALVILKEIPSLRELVGGVIIMSVVIYSTRVSLQG